MHKSLLSSSTFLVIILILAFDALFLRGSLFLLKLNLFTRILNP